MASVSEASVRYDAAALRNKAASMFAPERLSLIVCVGLAAALIFFFLLMVKPLILLPADILMWEETDFVGNIIKLRTGAPFYTPAADSNSLIYTPLAPLLTYAISWLMGRPTSIVAWRLIQLGFVTGAALLATLCCRKLRRLAFPNHAIASPATWSVFIFLAMFLAATAPNVNKFVYCLHVDALALLVSVFSFWAMLRYVETPGWKNLLLMAACPALGYLTKQFLVSWVAVMFLFLFLRRPRNIKHLALFGAVAVSLIGVAIGACYLLWGDAFIFWTFEVMGGERKRIVLSPDSYSVSLVRSFDHLVRVWPEIAAGMIGGWLILRGDNPRQLVPLWVAWLLLIATETLSSGAGWNTLYHFGPGVVIGAIWLFAALPAYWPESAAESSDAGRSLILKSLRYAGAVAAVATIFIVWHVVPTGNRTEARYWRALQTSPDANRYIADIEREFEGLAPEKILLDVGNWIYLRDGVLQKDRAVSLADQPLRGMYENFDVMVSHIRARRYEKILVRDFHSPFFLYDWGDWPKSSGVRQALLENYIEIRTIPPAQGNPLLQTQIMHSGAVSVFVPRPLENAASVRR